ncbi:MAG TPA: winged helix-turn-helix domain-containing protein, partial [Caldimonas sp.]|nr:winged helix-turn-helix domain-containing protein [Caldimonas sp.]
MSSPGAVQWARLFDLAEQPSLPLQARLRLAVVGAILEGHLGAGAPLPSSRELSSLLGISRNTVTAAYVQLVDEGFLEARPRSGVFVAVGARPTDPAAAEPLSNRQPVGLAPNWTERVRRSLTGRPTLAKPVRWQDYP